MSTNTVSGSSRSSRRQSAPWSDWTTRMRSTDISGAGGGVFGRTHFHWLRRRRGGGPGYLDQITQRGSRLVVKTGQTVHSESARQKFFDAARLQMQEDLQR
jgi:hypothetical protein